MKCGVLQKRFESYFFYTKVREFMRLLSDTELVKFTLTKENKGYFYLKKIDNILHFIIVILKNIS